MKQNRMRKFIAIVFVVTAIVSNDVILADDDVRISAAERDRHGFRIHTVHSPHQAGPTQIRVLLPDELAPQRTYPVIYVLPVEAKNGTRYGDGLLEVQRQNLHNKHDVIFVAPTFSALPWYADHPTDNEVRQESYFLMEVIQFVERTYPVSKTAKDRLLLGFSKSGWGAWSLLLRHPDTFGRAVAWDAPLMMTQVGRYGNGPIFATQENFETYRIDRLLRRFGQKLGDKQRLILTGYDNFRTHHQQAHLLLDELQIPHVYRDGPARKHDWHSGWVSEAVMLLLRES